MTIYIKDIVSEDFVKLIPSFILRRIYDLIAKNKYVAMQEYLEDNYNISIENIVNELMIKGFNYNKVKNLYILRVDENVKESKSQEKLSTLIRLVDYGNMEVRGINLIHSSIEYIKNNILNIYRIYQMKGENK